MSGESASRELKSSKALKEASDIISTSPAALQLRCCHHHHIHHRHHHHDGDHQRHHHLYRCHHQLILLNQLHLTSGSVTITIVERKEQCSQCCRYLQTLSGIAAEKNSTIIFPLPMGENVKYQISISISIWYQYQHQYQYQCQIFPLPMGENVKCQYQYR